MTKLKIQSTALRAATVAIVLAILISSMGLGAFAADTYTVSFDSQNGSAISDRTVPAGGIVAKPSKPIRSSYDFGGWYTDTSYKDRWNFETDTVTGDMTLYAKWSYRERNDFLDGDLIGASDPLDKDYIPPNTGTDDQPLVTVWLSPREANSIIKSAQDNTVHTDYIGSYGIPQNVLNLFAGKKLIHDTIAGDVVQVRLTLSPSLSSDALLLSGYIKGTEVTATKEKFKNLYGNRMQVIHLEQQGSFEQLVEVAAKVDLIALNKTNLYFYSYNRTTNIFSAIENPSYYVDSNGYLHFSTTLAGDIIVSDGAFVLK